MKRELIISCHRERMSGTPVFAGTRVPILSLIEHLKAGDRLDDFLEGFPTVSRQQAEGFLELAFQTTLREDKYARAA